MIDTLRSPVEGWGAFWVDDVTCDRCDAAWPAVMTDPNDGPDQRQYVTLHLGAQDIHLCPICADEVADEITRLLGEDVPMGLMPQDTETMCGLPNDFYVYRSPEYVAGLWWDDDAEVLRDDTGGKVPGRHDLYSAAQAQRWGPYSPRRKPLPDLRRTR